MEPTGAVSVHRKLPDGLVALLTKLEAFSHEMEHLPKREWALAFCLRPYWEFQGGTFLDPLPEETELANWIVYADPLPRAGFPPLVDLFGEALREPLRKEEETWVDPLRRSFMDLLEITAIEPEERATRWHLRSLGNGEHYAVEAGPWEEPQKVGRVLLGRIVPAGNETTLLVVAVPLSQKFGDDLYQAIHKLQQEIEVAAGDFELGTWKAFTKHYPHLLLWSLAELRLTLLADAEKHLKFVTESGAPFFFALALYEHADPEKFSQTFDQWPGWESVHEEASKTSSKREIRQKIWVYRNGNPAEASGAFSARLTLSRSQLLVECRTPELLNDIKHLLASNLGFALHFRGESCVMPSHPLKEVSLLEEEVPKWVVPVSREEEHRLLSQFVEKVYVDWAERHSPHLQGQTPRRYAADPKNRQVVEALIDELEQEDFVKQRTGKPGFDFNLLRAHIGARKG